jgi:hypothetical protein
MQDLCECNLMRRKSPDWWGPHGSEEERERAVGGSGWVDERGPVRKSDFPFSFSIFFNSKIIPSQENI